MKRYLMLLVILAAVFSLFVTGYFNLGRPLPQYDNLLRFHVIANSDTEADQALKRDVRDRILVEFGDMLATADSFAKSKELVARNLSRIEAVARDEVRQQGFDYPVKAMLGRFEFPIKSYGNMTLPAGNYEALRVVIGSGKGQNWWCVLFPPLCFVDISNSIASDTANPAVPTLTGKKPEQKVKVGFKIIELLARNRNHRLSQYERLKK